MSLDALSLALWSEPEKSYGNQGIARFVYGIFWWRINFPTTKPETFLQKFKNWHFGRQTSCFYRN